MHPKLNDRLTDAVIKQSNRRNAALFDTLLGSVDLCFMAFYIAITNRDISF